MKAKTISIIALGTLSVGILIGFIVGVLSISQPGGFSLTRMFIAWCIFGILSFILLVFSGFVRDQEILEERNKQTEEETNNDSNTPVQDVSIEPATITAEETTANEDSATGEDSEALDTAPYSGAVTDGNTATEEYTLVDRDTPPYENTITDEDTAAYEDDIADD